MADARATMARLRGRLRIAILIIAGVDLLALDLPALLTHLDVYLVVWPVVAGYLTLIAVLATEGVLIMRGWSWGGWRWPVLGLTLAVSVLVNALLPVAEVPGYANWAIDGIGWVAVVLLFDQHLAVLLAALAAHFATNFVHLGLGDDFTPLALINVGTDVVTIGAFQVTAGAATWMLRYAATSAARATEAEEAVREAEMIAARLHEDRRRRSHDLDAEVRPLLTGLADGELDPTADQTRRECAIAAARMRRLFAEGDDVDDRLLHELKACVDVAERRGVLVDLATQGSWPGLPREVRRGLTEAPVRVLSTARNWARVTVLGTDSSVSVSVVADGDAAGIPAEADGAVMITTVEDEDRLWVKATWQS
ncbi:hypothetical protein [Kutzneria kofuensis]|uniref:Signal transduction histidine kinase n=1 Tax=Kutzneria kofuensis TaxID=103725 RepID=A0A7W9NJT7_9PSEU|nr:hypothetical protein [Kutzneria kofuensis]MBB5895972.1 hypothetical protein [Kutzneria kofuensis]